MLADTALIYRVKYAVKRVSYIYIERESVCVRERDSVWLFQVPRLYNVYKEMGITHSFQNILDNIFIPLFEVSVNPGSHPQLHVFLEQVYLREF